MSLELEYRVRREQYQDLIRQAEQDGLAQIVRRQRSQPALPRRVAGWLGARMIKWGSILQNYAASPAAILSRTTTQTE